MSFHVKKVGSSFHPKEWGGGISEKQLSPRDTHVPSCVVLCVICKSRWEMYCISGMYELWELGIFSGFLGPNMYIICNMCPRKNATDLQTKPLAIRGLQIICTF